jgi:hypothetical protein
MKIVTMYEAEDGQQFRTEAQCVEYEQQCADLAAANDMLDNGASLMAALTRAHQTRPWWDSGLTVKDKVILMKTTKDTGFVVSAWQCSDRPGYKPCRLNHAGQVKLWGDSGSWSGPYGNWVGLQDLLRYARQTAAQHA